MKNNLLRITQVVGIGLAMAFTFSCSSGDDGGGGGGGDGNSIGNCNQTGIINGPSVSYMSNGFEAAVNYKNREKHWLYSVRCIKD